MGSNGVIPPPAIEQDDEITVMVTGFAPFRAESPKNPAWEITRALPPYLPPPSSHLASNDIPPGHPRVKILIYPEPIKVAYSSVRSLVPRLWDYRRSKSGSWYSDGQGPLTQDEESERDGAPKKQGIDYMIHIGMASGRRYYSIERKAHREGYLMKDVDGKVLEDDGGKKHQSKEEASRLQSAKEEHWLGKTTSPEEPPSENHNNGVEGWIRNVGQGGDSIQEVIRQKVTEDVTPGAQSGPKPQISLTAQDGSTAAGTRQQTPREIKADITQPHAHTPSEFLRVANPRSDSVEVGTLNEEWIWKGLPREIASDIDVDDVWKRWRYALPQADTRISEDAGRYLCDFIYYSSLAELTKRDEERRVLFFHVPVEADDKNVAKGVEIMIELIRAVVESGKQGKSRDEGWVHL